jgi:general secretion pathway protein E
MVEQMSQRFAGRGPRRAAIGQMLIEEGLITSEQLQDALRLQQRQGGRVGEILVDQGVVMPEDVIAVYSVQMNVPIIDLKRHTVQPEAVALVPEVIARRYTLIPVHLVGDSLVVAMSRPEDLRAIEHIKLQANRNVDIALATPAEIEEAIDANYRSSGELERRVSEFRVPERAHTEASVADMVARTPVTESLDLLISQAVKDRASDVHIEPYEHDLRIRYRVDGTLRDVTSLPIHAHGALVSRIKILSQMNIGERRMAQDGQFSVTVGNRSVDIRAATMETAHGERVTLRILDKSRSLFSLPELGLSSDHLETYRAVLKSPFGMVVVGGPTGSGKTTTLYASINQLDRERRNIMTIEDPVEYSFERISQTQVNIKAGITFAGGLRAILRHDPDVVLVGEIRDAETATTAVQAALTGHLVFSSTHATDSVGALLRLTDLGVEHYLVASTLVGVVAQRMVRRTCTRCAVPTPLTTVERKAYESELGDAPDTLMKGEGCSFCGGTGYWGRTGLFEILVMSEGIRKLLLENVGASKLKALAQDEGMVTMKRDGMLKAKAGSTTVEEVIRTVFSVS